MREVAKDTQPLETLWQTRAIMWTILSGEGLAVVLSLAPGTGADRWIFFALISLGIHWTSLLTLAALYLFREHLSHVRPQYVAYVALAVLLINTWFVVGVARLFLLGTWPLAQDSWGVLFLRWTGIVLAVGLLGLAAFQSHWRARQLAVRAKQAELESLHSRIRPHFLFNTLNTAVALVHRRPEEVERLLLDLADLFRAALAGPRQISLEDELALARRYVEIEALRFGERLTVRWILPGAMPAVTVPALSIQPLVENAIRHGIEPLPGGGEVEIAVSTTPGSVVVRISNPIPRTGTHANHGHQVGLHASQVRIEALTDGRGSVQTHVVDGRYVATVRLPVGDAE